MKITPCLGMKIPLKPLIFILSLLSLSIYGQDEISPSPSPSPSQLEQKSTSEITTPLPEKGQGWQVRIGAGLNSTNILFKGLPLSEKQYTGEADLKYGPSPALFLESAFLMDHSWGLIAGLSYEPTRKSRGGLLAGSKSQKVKVSEANSKFNALEIYANALYRWSSFYLPFGLHVKSAEFDLSSPLLNFNEPDLMLLGAQIGLGFYVSEQLAFELWGKSSSFSIFYQDLRTSFYLHEATGSVRYLQLVTKFSF